MLVALTETMLACWDILLIHVVVLLQWTSVVNTCCISEELFSNTTFTWKSMRIEKEAYTTDRVTQQGEYYLSRFD